MNYANKLENLHKMYKFLKNIQISKTDSERNKKSERAYKKNRY